MASIKFICPHCQQHLDAPDEAAGLPVPCPACGAQVQIPLSSVPSATASVGSASRSTVCAICQSPLGPIEAMTSCPACYAQYHSECWQENGGCAVYGCAQVPAVEQRRSIEIPVSVCGQEQKPCPACDREILAAAVRCRHCGATFASARPEDAGQFQKRVAQTERLPEVHRQVIGIFY